MPNNTKSPSHVTELLVIDHTDMLNLVQCTQDPWMGSMPIYKFWGHPITCWLCLHLNISILLVFV